MHVVLFPERDIRHSMLLDEPMSTSAFAFIGFSCFAPPRRMSRNECEYANVGVWVCACNEGSPGTLWMTAPGRFWLGEDSRSLMSPSKLRCQDPAWTSFRPSSGPSEGTFASWIYKRTTLLAPFCLLDLVRSPLSIWLLSIAFRLLSGRFKSSEASEQVVKFNKHCRNHSSPFTPHWVSTLCSADRSWSQSQDPRTLRRRRRSNTSFEKSGQQSSPFPTLPLPTQCDGGPFT